MSIEALQGNVEFFRTAELSVLQSETTTWGDSVLAIAAFRGHLECCQVICSRCPQLLYKSDNDGASALHEAARNNKAEVVKFLIDLDARNRAERRDIETGAVHSELLILMTDRYGRTALHLAAMEGHLECCQVICSSRCPQLLYKSDHYRRTALHRAAECNKGEVVRFLIDLDARNRAERRDIETGEADSELLILKRDSKGRTALHWAARQGHLECCQVICSRCPQLLYESNEEGRTALHEAAKRNRAEVVRFLIDLDARNRAERRDIETGDAHSELLILMTDSRGRTALHLAAIEKSIITIAELLLSDADSNNKLLMMVDDEKNTALHYALKSDLLDMAQLFIAEAGPETRTLLRMANDRNETPIALAAETNISNIVDLLDQSLDLGLGQFLSTTQLPGELWRQGVPHALVDSVTPDGNINIVADAIQKWPGCLECSDHENKKFLHLTLKSGHERLVRYILELPNLPEKYLNSQDTYGNTPLHIATSRGDPTIILLMLYDSRVDKFLLNKDRKSALDKINIDYDKRRAGVYGLMDRLDEKDLKDRSDFDLLVGALISTLSFTVGITVPGGYFSEGPHQGSAVLHKNISFDIFVISNTIALALSLSAVFSHFCTRRFKEEKNIKDQLEIATYCSLGAIFAMMVAFITGSYTVLSVSPWLAITVCVLCCSFFSIAFLAIWRLLRESKQKATK